MMSRAPLSQTSEDHPERDLQARARAGSCSTTSALADRIGVGVAAISDIDASGRSWASLQFLEDYSPTTIYTPTPTGRKAAVEIIRHHRLLEQYLAETLGQPYRRGARGGRPARACVVGGGRGTRIDASLGYPTHDPHGDPIPDAELNVDDDRLRPLHALSPGERSTVQRVPDDTDILRHLVDLRLLPGASFVEVVRVALFDWTGD